MMNEDNRETTAASISTTLDRIVRAAPRLKRHEVQELTRKLAAINASMGEHRVSGRHLERDHWEEDHDPNDLYEVRPSYHVIHDRTGNGHHHG